jgi:hypothetical protein
MKAINIPAAKHSLTRVVVEHRALGLKVIFHLNAQAATPIARKRKSSGQFVHESPDLFASRVAGAAE